MINDTPFTFAGMPVIVRRPLIVDRTFFERWFTRPWQPFVYTRIIPPTIPDGQIFRIADHFIMSEATWQKLSKF